MNRAINERQLAIAKIKLAAALVVLIALGLSGCVRRDDTDLPDGVSVMSQTCREVQK